MTHRFPLLGLAFLASAACAGLGVAGCDVRGFGTSDTSQPTVNNLTAIDAGEDAGGEPDAEVDAGTAPTSLGSPLCYAGPSSACYPDDPSTAKACGLAPDGGAYSATAGYDNATLACRVTPTTASQNGGAGVAAPACVPAGTAADGAWCKSSDECQAAFDCVGAGTCQRYCCSGNVQCAQQDFCDIQPTAQTSTVVVPVCMPIHPANGCKLLDQDGCAATETCSVVRENGLTSCVAVGSAKAGQSCDEAHCGAGLVCLGAPGERQCYQLCHTAQTECTAPAACKGGLPLFPDPTVGICQ
ncbi:MAG TPA: hypothetical protein VGG39_13595 [Polyangiaceae bacterium]|jgi:hypothetical protein